MKVQINKHVGLRGIASVIELVTVACVGLLLVFTGITYFSKPKTTNLNELSDPTKVAKTPEQVLRVQLTHMQTSAAGIYSQQRAQLVQQLQGTKDPKEIATLITAITGLDQLGAASPVSTPASQPGKK